MSQPANSYDELTYEPMAHAQSHPDRLAMVATLFGMQPRPITACRVLEIGCATGGNLLPMAAALPGSRFVGVDLSTGQIQQAREGSEELKLENVEWHAIDLADVNESFGRFDYIIAHGVYSWIPEPVREKLLSLCARLLEPMGVAYISYNTRPGADLREAMREMAHFHACRFSTAEERLARSRELFDFFGMACRTRNDGYARLVRDEVAQLSSLDDSYIAHEYLAEVNTACYFHEFAASLSRHGLQYLGESEVQSMGASDLAPEVGEGLRRMAGDLIEAEQYLDFLRNRSFRQTLVCRSSIELQRRIPAERLQNFYIASSTKPVMSDSDLPADAPLDFRGQDGVIFRASDAFAKAAFSELSEAWPHPLHFSELLVRASARSGVMADETAVRALSASLVACHAGSRALELRVTKPAFQTCVSERPKAFEISRWQARHGWRVTNARHENIMLGAPECQLLDALDGTRDLRTLEAAFSCAGAVIAEFAKSALVAS